MNIENNTDEGAKNDFYSENLNFKEDEIKAPSFVDLLEDIKDISKKNKSKVTLVLPTTLNKPFYLPKEKKTKLNNKKNEKILAEINESVSIDEKLKSDQTTKRKIKLSSLLPSFSILKSKEKDIENKLLDPYRNDKEKRDSLIEKVKKSKSVSIRTDSKEINKPKPPDKRKSVSERLEQASFRRSSVLKQQEEISIRREKEFEQKSITHSKNYEMQMTKKDFTLARASKWLTIVNTLIKLEYLYEVVLNTRESMSKDRKRWLASILIQKNYRKYRKYKAKKLRASMDEPEESILNILRSKMGDENKKKVYSQRVEASSLITRFLQDCAKSYKKIFFSFTRKIRLIQKYVHQHLLYNQHRVELLSKFIDACFPLFLLHAGIVLAGKGIDMKNLTSMDDSKIKTYSKTHSAYSIHGGMKSANFHSYLRNHLSSLKNVVKLFGGGHLKVSSLKSPVTKNILLDFIFLQRRKFLSKIESSRKIVHIPKFDMNDIRSFLQNDVDLLSAYLEPGDESDLSGKKNPLDRKTKSIDLNDRCLLLMKHVSPEDLGQLIFHITNQILTLYKKKSLSIDDKHLSVEKVKSFLIDSQLIEEPKERDHHPGTSPQKHSNDHQHHHQQQNHLNHQPYHPQKSSQDGQSPKATNSALASSQTQVNSQSSSPISPKSPSSGQSTPSPNKSFRRFSKKN